MADFTATIVFGVKEKELRYRDDKICLIPIDILEEHGMEAFTTEFNKEKPRNLIYGTGISLVDMVSH